MIRLAGWRNKRARSTKCKSKSDAATIDSVNQIDEDLPLLPLQSQS
jgi:hypothetical protein